MEETWRKVKNYPTYKVSNLGSVKSVTRITKKIRLGIEVSNTIKGRIVRPSITAKWPYLCFQSSEYNKTFRIHRLVAEAFIPNPENKRCVNHKNGIKTDNRIENLEWVTHSENSKHAFKTGLQTAHQKRKLSKDEVIEIRELICFGAESKVLAKEYNVHIQSIYDIKRRETWPNL